VKKIVIIILVLISGSLIAQTDGGYQGTNNASAYFYSGTMNENNQLNIPTYVWGQVRKPGLYIVPDNTSLLTLLSLAGGPTENAKLSKVKIVRPTTEGEKIIIIDLTEYIKTGDENLIPILQPGDTVIISGTVYYAFSKVADFVSKAAIILSVIVTLNNI